MARSVLLVDDHDGFRLETRAMLEAAGYDVTAEAIDAKGAIGAAERVRPDLVLLDIGLPDRSGLEVVEPIRDVAPGVIVVLVSARPPADFGDRLAEASADGFIDKAAMSPAQLRLVLAAVAGR